MCDFYIKNFLFINTYIIYAKIAVGCGFMNLDYLNKWFIVIEQMNNDNTYKLAWGRAIIESY